MPQTVIMSKSKFLKYIEHQIADDECVVFGDELKEISINKKEFKLNFLLAPDIFKLKGDIRPIARSKNISVCITKKNLLPKKHVKEIEKRK